MFISHIIDATIADVRWSSTRKDIISNSGSCFEFIPSSTQKFGNIFFVKSETDKKLLGDYIEKHKTLTSDHGNEEYLSNVPTPYASPYLIIVSKYYKFISLDRSITVISDDGNTQVIKFTHAQIDIHTSIHGNRLSSSIMVDSMYDTEVDVTRNPKWANIFAAMFADALKQFYTFLADTRSTEEIKIIENENGEEDYETGDSCIPVLSVDGSSIRDFLSGSKKEDIYVPESLRSHAGTITRQNINVDVASDGAPSSIVRRSGTKDNEEVQE